MRPYTWITDRRDGNLLPLRVLSNYPIGCRSLLSPAILLFEKKI